jgi:hypothetical protein
MLVLYLDAKSSRTLRRDCENNAERKKHMKTITKFTYAAFAVVTLGIGGVTAYAVFNEPIVSINGTSTPCYGIGVDRLDAFPATRTPGILYPQGCSFVPGDPNVFHSGISCVGPGSFCQLGSYYILFSYESLPDFQTVYPWATFVAGPDCRPHTTCEWRVEGCGNACSGTPPPCAGEIVVEQPAGHGLTDNSVTPVTFPNTNVGGNSSLTFTIRNIDTRGTLRVGVITKDGANAGDFTVTRNPITNGTFPFVVTFTPTGLGVRTATLHIDNSDCDENPFDIRLSGYGQSPVSAGWTLIGPTYFDGDAWPDYLLFDPGTRKTAIWFLNGTTFIRGAYGPTLPFGWRLIGAVNMDAVFPTGPAYVLFNPATGQSAIWYLNGTTFIRGAYGPTLPASWILVAAVGWAFESVDLNRDFQTDYLLFNPITRQTAAWFLSGVSLIGGGYGPTLPTGWNLIGANDFNSNRWSDFILANASTRQTALWYLNGIIFASGAFGPTLPAGWILKGSADFNRDGKPDYLLFNPSTRQTAVWYMNGAALVGAAYGPTLPR